jgi:hypothetical protein
MFTPEWTGSGLSIVDKQGRRLAWLGWGRKGISQTLTFEERRSIQEAIEALPDLYTAAKKALDSWNPRTVTESKAWDRLRDAVYKIEGRP